MVDFAPSNIPPVNEAREPGMDHAHYPFRKLPDAPRFNWPNNARIALTVTLMVDHWELAPDATSLPDPRIVSPLGKFHPDWLTWSQRAYGNRVGIFRLLHLLDQFDVTPSVALGSAAAKMCPELVDELSRRNACFMAHGDFASRRITSKMTAAEERAFIAQSRDAVAAATGTVPLGWCGQDFNESADTPAYLLEAGFAYTTDWANDDRPYLLDGGLVALPPQPEWNDVEAMRLRGVRIPDWADNVAEAFAGLHDEGGGTFNLTLHPWYAGQPHRIRYVKDALSRILGKSGIWVTTTDAIGLHVRPQL
jgi:peptidoglycan/xylan/chitin deacetylase (PgdA/CDA1 family)